MYPRIVEIGPITLYSYGAMVALGALAAGWLAQLELNRYYRAGRIGSVELPTDNTDRRDRATTREGSPAELVWTLTVLAVGAGLVGAKLLTIISDPAQFFIDPIGTLFSSGGFTFYGGLIAGALAVVWYVRRRDLNVPRFADAVCPGLILAYGIGRLGCHLAGDGCWGIPADLSAQPAWLPTWLWAETYPKAIIGSPAQPVYPTPLYEFGACVLIFGILWAVRKHIFKAGWLFSLYLLLNGVERFFIEKIRVNVEHQALGMTFTQAQLVAVLLMTAGAVGLALTTRRRSSRAGEPVADEREGESRAAATTA